MLLIASLSTTPSVDRLRQIPHEFWVRMGLAVLVVVATVIILRKLANVNKVVLAVVVVMGLSFVGFSWIYERNEPKWASPAVSWLSGFFPNKAKLSSR